MNVPLSYAIGYYLPDSSSAKATMKNLGVIIGLSTPPAVR